MPLTGSAKLRIKSFKDKKFSLSSTVNCVYCDDLLSYENATVDHVIPVSSGGKSNDKNLVISCRACNLQKGSFSRFPNIILGKEYAKSLIENKVGVAWINSDPFCKNPEKSKNRICVIAKRAT